MPAEVRIAIYKALKLMNLKQIFSLGSNLGIQGVSEAELNKLLRGVMNKVYSSLNHSASLRTN